MSELIIASNRLPVNIKTDENNNLNVIPSAGGLATGLKSYHKNNNSLWIGWPGIIPDSEESEKSINNLLKEEDCKAVYLSEDLVHNYYDGFSNATLWPLFHYFTEIAKFRTTYWEAYRKVNKLFADAIINEASEGATVWVHDYQLLLVPNMLREARPDLHIGFFLHIPFPSYEVIRVLPWREEILQGMMGADLLGFHTYDYSRHFISSIKRLLGNEVEFNQIKLNERHVHVDVFPMSIDYDKFDSLARIVQNKPINERSKIHRDIDRFLLSAPDRQLILSIDRLDYTKGIPERLKAFRYFLRTNPDYIEKVSLIMLTVPSREDVDHYKKLKSEVDNLVGRINGEFGTLTWNPVIYFYRSLPFENLIELYSSADVALLTPLRDGMNLVAKEYIASKVNHNGVLILSEMAGAAKELGEALSVNPTNIRATAETIHRALTMQADERRSSVMAMQKRIKRYDVFKWASEFMKALKKTEEKKLDIQTRKISNKLTKSINTRFNNASLKTIFLDYDGTLQRFFDDPQKAGPDKELHDLVNNLASIENTDLVIISGRDKETLGKWFEAENFTMIAEHGAWIKKPGREWKESKTLHSEWKNNLYPILESYVDRTPGSFIEEKNYSLVWHYRKVDVDMGSLRALELVHDVSNLIINQDLEILEGNKVIEIKVSGVNKGIAASNHILNKNRDFIMAIGDDWTDEYLFKELPEDTISVKVGSSNTAAKYYLENYKDVRNFLKNLYEYTLK